MHDAGLPEAAAAPPRAGGLRVAAAMAVLLRGEEQRRERGGAVQGDGLSRVVLLGRGGHLQVLSTRAASAGRPSGQRGVRSGPHGAAGRAALPAGGAVVAIGPDDGGYREPFRRERGDQGEIGAVDRRGGPADRELRAGGSVADPNEPRSEADDSKLQREERWMGGGDGG